jgi:hypothetical protein
MKRLFSITGLTLLVSLQVLAQHQTAPSQRSLGVIPVFEPMAGKTCISVGLVFRFGKD